MFKRYVFPCIKEALQDTPVVFIMGPRQCGKTTLLRSIIDDSWTYITFDDQSQYAAACVDPAGFIKNMSAQRIAIDEVQRVPEVLIAIKQVVDEHRIPGRFLLTGSANALVLPHVVDSLAGRVETIYLNTLSESEIKGKIPCFLSNLLSCNPPSSNEIRVREKLIQRVVTGCFPEPLQREKAHRVRAWYKQYALALIQKDIHVISQIDHLDKMEKLLKLLAFFSGKLINFSELGNKIGLDRLTVKKYVTLLEQLFLVRTLPAWHANEYKRLIKTPKMHLVDTGLICALRGMNDEFLSLNPDSFGALLETFVVNELEKQASFLEEDITFYHYRDKDKKEIDLIIENESGDCFAVEVKASATLGARDFSGMYRFKSIAGDRFKFGVLLYDGDQTIFWEENIVAIPFSALWN